MNQLINKIIFSALTLSLTMNAMGGASDNQPRGERKILLLNGTWQVEEGGMDKIPERFTHSIVVPGLMDMATPSFIEPGPKVSDRSALSQKDPRRDAFWYRRTFQLNGPVEEFVQLSIGKALYGTRVILNSTLR